ncbi:MAG: ROK family protein [Alphaproteobacteria bacterium]|nr:ROK family protein [Alphaproteobacteria bacterium]MBU2084565.1 ROK family protein [Alphaproteobacteria bacterium]MBU2142007.1 ROK family protein [Alphaproteobacteria bacterium]MBU2196899.1 ROK family protein [Alphaproteobacteria bacterium]
MSKQNTFLVGGVDGGGTTFKCCISTPEGEILRSERFVTAGPEDTIDACADFFARCTASGQPAQAIGIACFGPIEIDPQSANYGSILNTPKLGWSGFNVRDELALRTGLPVSVDTDVNGALAAEMAWGAAREARSAVYVTVGTGIGAGIYANGDFLGRPTHPEFGHIRVTRHRDDIYSGACSFHGDCLEGLTSARAVEARFGPPELMAPDHPGWDIVACYLAQACISLTLTVRPEKIVLGGGLLLAPGLIDRIHEQYTAMMNGYLDLPDSAAAQFIVLPGLGDNAGLLGGAQLALKSVAGQ